MATSTGEKLGQIDAQDDYGQALAEGEITRILKTVQAAKFKKSETLVKTGDTEFKPRSLVEIAFAAEGKRKEAEEAAEQKLKQQSSDADAGEQGLGTVEEAGVAFSVEQDSVQHTAAQRGVFSEPVVDETSQDSEQAKQHAEEAALQQRAKENEAIRLAAEKEGYKRGFEAGIEASKKAEPTPEEVAFLQEKEKERQSVIDKFHKAIAAIASPQAIDSSALETAINEAVVELASERAGQAIIENPEAFLVRIKKLVDDIKTGTQQIEILLNPSDLVAIEGWIKDSPVPTGWHFVRDETLANGDIHLKLGGIEISDKLNSGLYKKAEILGQNKEAIAENLDYGNFNVSSGQNLEEDEQLKSDNQNTNDLTDVAAEGTESIPVLEGFEPAEAEDEASQSSEQDAGDLANVTAEGTESIPVLEGFEPVEAEDEASQSSEQDAEDLANVTAEGTESIPVLAGFEPVEAENEASQSSEQDAERSEDSYVNEIETTDPDSSLQRAKVAKRPTFIPDSSKEVDLEDEMSSLPVLEGFEPIEGDEQ